MILEQQTTALGVVASIGALLFASYVVLQMIYNIYLHPLSRIPGPASWSASRLPFVYSLLKGTIVHDIQALHGKYGSILRIAPDEVTFAHEDAWADIFQSRSDSFLKDPVWWATQPGEPDNLITAISPEKHVRMRKALAPGFTVRALKSQEHILQQYANLLVERLTDLARGDKASGKGVELDIAPWFNFITFDIFGDLGFGESFNCLHDSRYHPWIALLFNSVKAASFIVATRFYPLLQSILLRCIPPSLKKVQQRHFQQIADKVDRRLNFELERPDIMDHVIKRQDKDAFSVGEMYHTFMILTTAGSETTATVLGGILNYLVSYPDKLEALVKEVRSNFPEIENISLDALEKLPYLNAVINEGLRLCPPIPWMLPRRVPKGGHTVCDIWLPGGTPVSIQAYTMNRDPKAFHASTSFLPERWLPDQIADPKSAVGPRSCMGVHLAKAEMRLILAKLLWTFDFTAVKGKTLVWEQLRTFLLVEKKPIMVHMACR
ncbi:cytochrome P450 [Astrocystis sublimbata]|nr:cytochrome P450 [Astrocystis sublimbata]